MLYLVDGYNITKGDPATRALSLEEQRDALIARLRVRGPDLLGRGRIVVVFDGDGIGRQGSSAPVEVRFSRGSSADDVIVGLAGLASEKVCVVSSDREVVQRVRTHASGEVEARGREALYEAAGKGSARRKRARYPAGSVGIPRGANEITRELKDIWLAEEEE